MDTLSITSGSNKKRTKGERVELNTGHVVQELQEWLSVDDGQEESWWSGHLWEDNDRGKRQPTNTVRWQGSACVVVDVDYYGEEKSAKERHQAPPESYRSKLEELTVPCSLWHHTPRGARFVFVLDRVVEDPDRIQLIGRGASGVVNTCLREAGLSAKLNNRRKPVGGYYADTQTLDLARFMFKPITEVNGHRREAEVHLFTDDLFSPEDLVQFASQVDDTPQSDVERILATMPCEGDNDGSLELMRCAARAVRLGVGSVEAFLKATEAWNARRVKPWTEQELTKRFTDALARYKEEGVISIPYSEKGEPIYSVAILDNILKHDPKYAGKFGLSWRGMIATFEGEELQDGTIHRLRSELVERYRFKNVPKADVEDAVGSLVEENAHDPVVDYLEGLKWDGKERIKRIPKVILGCSEELAQTYITRWMVGAVARAMCPGVKMDTVLILVGKQGRFKSTFFATLAGAWFVDTPIDIHDSGKDGYLVAHQSWIYEFAEFDGVYRKADISRLRAWLSSRKDTFRPPYGRRSRTFPRRWVVVGTSNPPDVVRDPEGSRRYWVIETGDSTINISKLKAWRDQLWAEAVHLHAHGVQHYLTVEESRMQEQANLLFAPEDPEGDKVAQALEALETSGSHEHTVGSVISQAFPYSGGKCPPALVQLTTRKLRQLGYKPLIQRDGSGASRKTSRIWVKKQ